MKSPSQIKVSTISFIVALILSIAVFGFIAFFAISSFLQTEPVDPNDDEITSEFNNKDPESAEVIPPEEIEKIEGNSFSVLVAGYGLGEDSFDAMVVVDVNKEEQKVTIYPINVDTKVYVGHADGMGNLNIRMGDLIKYEDMQYTVDKIKATTGLKVSNFITFTAEGFIEAFDKFNENGDYTYVVPKDMEHFYADAPEITETPEAPEGTEVEEAEDLSQYNISFKKGDKLTSGLDIYNMLRYKGDSSSDRITRQASFVRDVLQKIIPKHFKEGNLSKIVVDAQALAKLTESISTNITVGTFITETFDLISKIPEFSFGTSSKFTNGITNFK